MKKKEFVSAVLLVGAAILLSLVLGFCRLTIDLGLETALDAFGQALGVE